jgi:hypothetical protein
MAEFKLGRLRFVWKGTWTTGTAYVKDDIVKYGGSTFVCVQGHIANANFDVDLTATKWTVMSQGQEWKTAPWTTGIVYKVGDIVKNGGIAYIAVENHTASTEENTGFYDDLDEGYWNIYSEGFDWKGDWTVSTYYRINDIVRYNSIAYICVDAHTSDSAEIGSPGEAALDGLEVDQSKWEILTEGIKWRGFWSNSPLPSTRVAVRYRLNDVVKFGGQAYICINPHTSDPTLFEEYRWQILSSGLEYEGTWISSTEYQVGDIVKYGGNAYVSNQRGTNRIPELSPTFWTLFSEGYVQADRYDSNNAYLVGSVVKYGGNQFVATTNVSVNETPKTNPGKWRPHTEAFRWLSDWPSVGDSATDSFYKPGDIAKYAATSYVCVRQHVPSSNEFTNFVTLTFEETIAGTNRVVLASGNTSEFNEGQKVTLVGVGFGGLSAGTYYIKSVPSSTEFTLSTSLDPVTGSPEATVTLTSDTGSMDLQFSNRPDTDADGYFWNTFAEGDANNVLIRRGDLVTRSATQNKRLPKGEIGSYLKSGELDLEWGKVGVITRIFYVSTDGIDSPSRGTTLDDPWRTVKFACEYVRNTDIASRSQPVVINVKTGVYTEAFPISVPKYVSLVGDELRMSIIEPTPATSGSDKFYLRDSTTMRNFTFRGATGANLPNGTTAGLSRENQYGTARPTGGAWVSLDPGTGPNDESVWVGERSPYVQNITFFGDFCVGQKIDGALHNGGNKSITSNDFTTILSNGIGAWCTNQGRGELVSVFAYYSYIGYLCENGGVIRATNGNNSYGTFGSVSEGVDPTEISRTATVDNRRLEAIIDRVATDGQNEILYVEYNNAGQEYTTAEYVFSGSGQTNSVVTTTVVKNGGVTEVRVLAEGNNYLSVVNNAQAGSNIDIRLGAADIQPSNAYVGERIIITDGKGAGQFAYITSFDGGTKLATLGMESFQPLTIIQTVASTGRAVVNNTATLIADMPFTITTNLAFGGLAPATQYYVKSVISSTEFTIYTDTDLKTAISLSNGTGTMTLNKSGWDTLISDITETVTGATNASPVVVTTLITHAITTGLEVRFSGVLGMTELNSGRYYAKKIANNAFELYEDTSLTIPLNGSAFGEWTSGGTQVATAQKSIPVFLDTTTRYTIEPRLTFSTGSGAEATAIQTQGINTISTSTVGGGYTNSPTVIISGDGTSTGGEGAEASATIAGGLGDIIVQSTGIGFQQVPTIRIVGGGLPPGGLYKEFESGLIVQIGDYIRSSLGRYYEVIQTGTLGSTQPTHTTGSSSSGSASLLYLGTEATASATIIRSIKSISVTNGGSGYVTPPSVSVTGNGGSGAIISSQISQVVGSFNIVNNGTNYTEPPSVSIIGGDPLEFATATAVLSGIVTSIIVNEGGNGYAPLTTTVELVGGGGSGATSTVEIDNGEWVDGVTPGVITSINIVTAGSNYSTAPTVVITGTGQDAIAISRITGIVSNIVVVNPGRGYQSPPSAQLSGGGGTGATAIPVLTGSVTSVSVVDGGSGWVGTPALVFSGGNGSNAAAEVTAMDSVIGTVTVLTPGDGYVRNPAISVTGGGLEYNQVKFSTEIGQVVNGVLTDIVFGTNYNSATLGNNYLKSYTSVNLSSQKEAIITALNFARNLLIDNTTNTTAISRINSNFENITDIIEQENPLAISYPLTYPTPANTDSGIVNASVLLQSNRDFLSNELIAWINDQIDNATTGSIWENFTYDSVLYSRETSYLIDAFTFDLLYGGNSAIARLAASYYLEATSYILGEEDQIVSAYNYLRSIVDDIILQTPIARSPGNTSTQNTSGGAGSLAAVTEVQGLIDIVTAVVENGLSVLPTTIPPTYSGGNATLATVRTSLLADTTNIQTATINFINSNFGGRGAILRARINGTIQNITVNDPGGSFDSDPLITFVGGNNIRTSVAGTRYYNTAVGQVAITEQRLQTLDGIDRLRVVARSVIQNQAPATSFQNAVGRVTASGYTPPAQIAAITDIWSRVVYYTIENGESYSSSPFLLRANRQFIRDEAMAFWNANFPGELSSAVESRDVGLLIDAICSDLESRGVNFTLNAGISQIFTTKKGTSLVGVQSGIDFIKDLALDIAQNTVIDIPLTAIGLTSTEVTTNNIVVIDTATFTVGDAVLITGIPSGVSQGGLQSGTQYYIAEIDGSTIIRLSTSIGGDVINLTTATPAGVYVTKQTIGVNISFESDALSAIENNFNLAKAMMAVIVANSAYSTAASLLSNNRKYVVAEVIAYINATYQDFNYNQAAFGRDFDVIVDAISYDLVNTISNLPTVTNTRTGVVSRIDVVSGGVGYSEGTAISFIGGSPSVPAQATAIRRPLDGTIIGFNITNRGRGYASAPQVVITPDPGSGAFGRCKVVGGSVSVVTIIRPGTGYLAGPQILITDPNNTEDALFFTRTANGVLDQPRFTQRGVEYTQADGFVDGDGFADIPQTGGFVYVDNLTNIPTPGANLQFDGNSTFYKLVTIREVQGPSGLIGARNLITLNKAFIQNEIISYLNNFTYNEAKCSRDTGFLIDAIADDVTFGSNARRLAFIQQYQRGLYSDIFEQQRMQHAFSYEYLKSQIDELFDDPTYTDAKYDNVGTTLDIVSEWLKNEEIFRALPTTVTIPDGGFNTQHDAGKNLLLLNENFIVSQTLAYAVLNNLCTGFNQARFDSDFRQMVRNVAFDLTYAGNTLQRQFGTSYYVNGTLVIPGLPGPVITYKSEYLDLIDYINDVMQDVATNTPLASLTGNEFTQNTSIVPPGGAGTASLITQLITDFKNIVNEGTSVIGATTGTIVLVGQVTTGSFDADVRTALLTAKATFQAGVNAWLNDNFVNFTYNQAVCFRDTGLIVQAIADDIFGDVAKSVEAGQRYYAATAALVIAEQKPQTIAAINQINYIIQQVIRNVTYTRTQSIAFQERQPAITDGADASQQLADSAVIIRIILENGSLLDEVKQLLLDNRAFLAAETVAYVSASYENLNYNTELCERDAGLIVDAIAYDIYGGFSRSREAGLRYYSSASALIAITGEQAEPTKDALNYLNSLIQSVINNEDPPIRFQETLSRTPNSAVPSYIDTLLLDEKVSDCIEEIISVIEGGPSSLPPGRYSARLQISPPLSILNTPDHNTPIVLRSKYSQVRLTGHDFLSIGTGDKNDTNYPGIPLNAPNQLNEVRESGGGRVFYTSTDQDGNFRVGELFKVEQSTGIATLNADAFNLSGLNELALGGVSLGGSGAVINEFSTDGTFFLNSDSIVPTQKAIRTYIQSALGSGGGNIAVNAVTAGDVFITGREIDTVGGGSLSMISPNGIEISSGASSIDSFTGALRVAGGVGIGENINVGGTASFGGNVTVTSTGHLTIAKGTTSQRPGAPATGMMRFNTETNAFEGYIADTWSDVGGGGRPWTIRNSAYTAQNNDRIIVNTQSTSVTITLPLNPNTGDTIRFLDGAGTFDFNNLIINRNGQLIMGDAENLVVNNRFAGFQLVFYNTTFGWRLGDV